MCALFLNEHRCGCGKLLLKGVFFDGTLEIKCKKCGTINKIGSIKLVDDKDHYLLVINEKSIVVNVSDSACDTLGYPREELIGKHFTKINPFISEEICKKIFGPETALTEENYFQIDTVHQLKSGKKISIIASLKLYKLNNKERFVLLSAKIKTKTSELKIEKGIYKFFYNKCDFYFDLDKNGIGEYESPSAKKLFGFSVERNIGKSYFDFLPTNERIKFQKTFKYFSENETPFRIEDAVNIDPNGNTIHSELYFTPKFDDLGKFLGYRVLGMKNNKSLN